MMKTRPLNMTQACMSIIIIAYNMAREVPRTVQSFLPPYQQGVKGEDIEILVMENGSSDPIPKDIIESWPDNVRYIPIPNAHPSPAKALNLGVEMSMGAWVCPVIDGARMVTPGLLLDVKALIKAHDNPVIASLGWHLGDEPQQFSSQKGYNQSVEDEILKSISWPDDGYKLFDVSCLGSSAGNAWLRPISESNVLFMKKTAYQAMGGYDEAFDIAGGGLVNLDFFKRAIEDETRQYILLMSEASFHQYHGGVSTSRSVRLPSLEDAARTTWDIYAQQYRDIRGVDFKASKRDPILYGKIHKQLHALLRRSVYIYDGVDKT
jgi:glycosyltransferase involved in cell wall biosynthesis